MENGLAKKIITHYPNADKADKKTKKGDISKLGTYSYSVETNKLNTPFVILNCYTQYNYGIPHYRNGTFDYAAFESLLSKITFRFANRNLRFVYPLIACDRGNADPEKILSLLDKHFENEDHTLVLFKEPGRYKTDRNLNLVKKLYPNTKTR